MRIRRKSVIIVAVIFLPLLIMGVVALFSAPTQNQYEPIEVSPEELAEEALVNERAEADLVELISMNPLVAHLPHYSGQFEIHFGVPSDNEVSYEIIINPVSNSGTSAHETEVKFLVETAERWIEDRGVDPDSLNIKWSTK